MDELERIYKGFEQNSGRKNNRENAFWNNQTEGNNQPNPRQKDAERLEEEIQSLYANRKFLNRMISAFLAIGISSAGINSIAKIGLPMIATGTLGGLVLAVFFGNTVSKIKLEGNRPKFDGEFFGASIQTAAVGTALLIGYREQREVARITKIGQKRFIEEVKAYEKKPQIKETPLGGGALTAGCLLLLALGILLMTKGDKKKSW
jgi:hypothetical protein